MPTGFSLSSPVDDSSTDAPGNTACAKRYAELSKSNSTSTAAKADRSFDQGGLTGTFINQGLTAFSSASEARANVDRSLSVISDCPHFASVEKDGTRSEYTLAALSFPKLGDQTFAAKLTVMSKDLTILGQVVITRDGPLVQLVTAGSLTGPAIETTEKVVRAGYAKLHLLR